MKKKILEIALVIVLTVTATVGVLAASGKIEIKAILDQGIAIKFNSETKILTDSNGNTTYPIIYNDTTYLPVRAVSGLLGAPVNWDGDTRR